MISMDELLQGKIKLQDVPKEHQENLKILLDRINIIRTKYGKSMTVSSGYRSKEDHLRIYKEKGITDTAKIPMKSHHLFGRAVDIADPNQSLQKWIKDNVKVLEDAGLWMEDFSATKTWCHFQCVPPGSGKRFYMP